MSVRYHHDAREPTEPTARLRSRLGEELELVEDVVSQIERRGQEASRRFDELEREADRVAGDEARRHRMRALIGEFDRLRVAACLTTQFLQLRSDEFTGRPLQ